MRIDREAFLIAVAALAGCERADHHAPPPPAPRVAAPIAPPSPPTPPPAIAMERAPVVEQTVPAPPPPPPRVARARPRATPKQWFLSLSAATREQVTTACAMRASHACRVSLRRMMPPPPEGADPTSEPTSDGEALPDPVASLPADKVAAYCKEDFTPPSCETPLVVAFDNQPIDFAPASRAAFAFVPGRAVATDWPTAATPWIALDVDGDGAITSGAELFGSSTALPGGGVATNGFLALAPLDANGDGVLDARDPMFAKLVLWSDRDGDHRSSPDELRPLASVVTAISLAYTHDARCNQRDDCEGERATLHWRDDRGADRVGTVVDVYLPRP